MHLSATIPLSDMKCRRSGSRESEWITVMCSGSVQDVNDVLSRGSECCDGIRCAWYFGLGPLLHRADKHAIMLVWFPWFV